MKNDVRYDTQEDLVVVVDKLDNILKHVPRKESHQKNLLHRTTAILIFNNEGKMLLQKRSKDKDTYANYYTVAAGGHVLKGQDYEEAAERELYEELRVSGELEYIKTLLVPDSIHSTMTATFRLTHNGPFVFNTYEIEKVEFFDIKDIVKIKNLTPQAKKVFKELKII